MSATGQTEPLGKGQHSDFYEEGSNNYIMTKFREDSNDAAQRRTIQGDSSQGQLSKES